MQITHKTHLHHSLLWKTTKLDNNLHYGSSINDVIGWVEDFVTTVYKPLC